MCADCDPHLTILKEQGHEIQSETGHTLLTSTRPQQVAERGRGLIVILHSTTSLSISWPAVTCIIKTDSNPGDQSRCWFRDPR